MNLSNATKSQKDRLSYLQTYFSKCHNSAFFISGLMWWDVTTTTCRFFSLLYTLALAADAATGLQVLYSIYKVESTKKEEIVSTLLEN